MAIISKSTKEIKNKLIVTREDGRGDNRRKRRERGKPRNMIRGLMGTEKGWGFDYGSRVIGVSKRGKAGEL